MSRFSVATAAIVTLIVISLVILYDENATLDSDSFYATWTLEEFNIPNVPSTQPNQTLPSMRVLPPSIPEEFIRDKKRNYSGVFFDHCELAHLNPWDPSVMKFVNPNNPAPCNVTIEMFTKLENGTLTKSLNKTDSKCDYRCIWALDDYDMKLDKWREITEPVKPKCDIVETKCHDKHHTFYEYMHTQIYRPDPVQSENEDVPPDVIVIIIDAVSHSSFVRTLPRTYHELMVNYEAIQFPHLNKIDLNSRPNAIAMFFGKSIRNIDKSPTSVGYEADFKNDDDCKKRLDEDQWIGKRFKSAGYTTMMNEDWSSGAFNFPRCIGFDEKAADHMMRAFQQRAANKRLYKNVLENSCKEPFETLMDYLDHFITAYPDKPKFSITWSTELSHNDNNKLFHADNYFYEFFRKHEQNLNNSFVFIMADHGSRAGSLRSTNVGFLEDTNPFLILSLPWSLRRDAQITATLRANALQLITHYDIYATFVDIARPKRRQRNAKKIILHGSSLLQPLPQPRTCDRLRVPFEYCSCIHRSTILPGNNTIGEEAALKMVEHMNQVIKTDPTIKDICVPIGLNTSAGIQVEQFEGTGNFSLYQVTFSIQPGGGRLWGYVGREPNSTDIKIMSARLGRLDEYAPTAFCAKKSDFAGYCYCKSLIKS